MDKVNFETLYSKYINEKVGYAFAGVVRKNIFNRAKSRDEDTFINGILTIPSKISTEDLVIAIKSPFEAVLDTSKMQSQLCDEVEAVQLLWLNFMAELYKETYKEDYVNYMATKQDKSQGHDRDAFAMLKAYYEEEFENSLFYVETKQQ